MPLEMQRMQGWCLSKGSGDFFVEYKHDLVYIYVMYVGIAIFVVACVILIFVVERMLIMIMS